MIYSEGISGCADTGARARRRESRRNCLLTVKSNFCFRGFALAGVRPYFFSPFSVYFANFAELNREFLQLPRKILFFSRAALIKVHRPAG